jgi:hypothetical protein
MRRKTQGIPDTPHSCERGRLTAHHTRTSWRRAGAFLRRFPYGMGPRFASMRLDLRMASAGSRQGSLVTPGGAPMQPECRGDEPRPAGAAPRSINRRHRLTPLMSEMGHLICFYSYIVKRQTCTASGKRLVEFRVRAR